MDVRLVLQYFSCLFVRQVSQSFSRFDIHLRMFLNRHTLSQSRETSFSASCLQLIKLSIHPSNVGMEPGSFTGERPCGCAGLLTSKSIFEVSMGAFLIAANSVILQEGVVLDGGCRVRASQSYSVASSFWLPQLLLLMHQASFTYTTVDFFGYLVVLWVYHRLLYSGTLTTAEMKAR